MGSNKELTFDHLLPRSKGGKTNWDNVVTACSSCNVKKGGRLLSKSGMTLNKMPYQPSTEDLHRNGKNFPPNFLLLCRKFGGKFFPFLCRSSGDG